MPRPRKWRKVSYIPKNEIFGPLDRDDKDIESITMYVEELESIRLMDLEKLDQVQCAQKMEIARSTFQRLYSEAKRKAADALVNGKIIKIHGGNYTLNICKMGCRECGYSWNESYENTNSEEIQCPKCNSKIQLKCNENIENEACCRCYRKGRCGKKQRD